MLRPDDKKKFLEELEEVPIVSVVCKRVGVSKATIYRWREEMPKFAREMDKAIDRGRQSITDLAEGQTIGLMKKGDFRAIRYWLDNNDKRYYKPRKPISPPPRQIHTVQIEVVPPKQPSRPEKEKPMYIKRDGKLLRIVSMDPKRESTGTADSASGSDTSPKALPASQTTQGTTGSNSSTQDKKPDSST